MKGFKEYLREAEVKNLMDGLKENDNRLFDAIGKYIEQNEKMSKADANALLKLAERFPDEAIPSVGEVYRGFKSPIGDVIDLDFNRKDGEFIANFKHVGYSTCESWTNEWEIAERYRKYGYGTAPMGDSDQEPIKAILKLKPKAGQGFVANAEMMSIVTPKRYDDVESLRIVGEKINCVISIEPSEYERIINERNLIKGKEALDNDNPNKAIKMFAKSNRKYKKGGVK